MGDSGENHWGLKPCKVKTDFFLEPTLPKTNIAPENGWWEDESSYWEGLCSWDMLVSQRVLLPVRKQSP